MDYAEKDFGKMIKKNSQSQRHELLPRKINCMRIYDRNLQEYPVTVDLYDKYARVVDYGEEPMSEERLNSCLSLIHRMAYIDEGKIVYSYRAKRENGEQHEKNSESLRLTVVENGHNFIVDLKMYADTGLFLDHEETRAMIEERAEGCDVLNLFSYTGSFSVYAACGGAKTVTSVDLSSTYTNWANENLALNGFSGQNYQCVCMDAKKFVEQAKQNHSKYDIIIFDPPAFSNSRKMDEDFDVGKDYADWIKNLSYLLRDNGFILFSNNLSGFKMDKRRLKGFDVKEITGQVMAPGFVKSRKGTVRSWIMANDDNSLTLDWSEEPKKEKRERRESFGERREYGKREYKPRSEHREFRKTRDFRESKDYGRGHSDRFERPRFDRDDNRERRDYREKRYEHSERFDRYNRNDRDEGRRDSYERSDRYHSSERYTDRPKYNERRERFDRESHNRDYHREPRRNDNHDDRRPPRREKPYGYDSFKPARNRNDSSDFFWNNEDFNK